MLPLRSRPLEPPVNIHTKIIDPKTIKGVLRPSEVLALLSSSSSSYCPVSSSYWPVSSRYCPGLHLWRRGGRLYFQTSQLWDRVHLSPNASLFIANIFVWNLGNFSMFTNLRFSDWLHGSGRRRGSAHGSRMSPWPQPRLHHQGPPPPQQ